MLTTVFWRLCQRHYLTIKGWIPVISRERAYRSTVGGAAVGRAALARGAQDGDVAETEEAEEAVAAHQLLVVAARRRGVGARHQFLDALGRRKGAGGHGEGQDGGEVGELHFEGWGGDELEKLCLSCWL
jgi:hypothetical protein